jgi:hypothetical protein
MGGAFSASRRRVKGTDKQNPHGPNNFPGPPLGYKKGPKLYGGLTILNKRIE